MNKHEGRYVAVVKMNTLDGASTVTLVKHKRIGHT